MLVVHTTDHLTSAPPLHVYKDPHDTPLSIDKIQSPEYHIQSQVLDGVGEACGG